MKTAVVLHSTLCVGGVAFQRAITYVNFRIYSNMFRVSVHADNLTVMLKHAREGGKQLCCIQLVVM